MSKKNVSDALWEMLADAGVKRCYGIVGDAMNPIIDGLRRNGKIDFIHVRHEEAGVFAASAEANLTGEPVAVCGTAGPRSHAPDQRTHRCAQGRGPGHRDCWRYGQFGDRYGNARGVEPVCLLFHSITLHGPYREPGADARGGADSHSGRDCGKWTDGRRDPWRRRRTARAGPLL